jgi:hypothetical protein
VSGRWIVTEPSGGSDALWMRLEFRPTRRAWVTLGYGRESRGDEAYFIEDRDVCHSATEGECCHAGGAGGLVMKSALAGWMHRRGAGCRARRALSARLSACVE